MGYYKRLLMAASRGLTMTSSPPLLHHRRHLSTAVCKSSPWLMIPSHLEACCYTSDTEARTRDYSFYRLSDKKTFSLHNKSRSKIPIHHDAFCIGSSRGWLLYCDPLDCTLLLTNPLLRNPPTVPLPPVTTLSTINAASGCRPENKSERWRLLANENDDWEPEEMNSRVIEKFDISGPPNSKECVVMVIQYWKINNLAFCKPALKMESWTNLTTTLKKQICDICYFSKENLFYISDEYCNIETWDLNDHLKPKRAVYEPNFTWYSDVFAGNEYEVWIRDQCTRESYLVESSGDILLVIWYYCDKINKDGKFVHKSESVDVRSDITHRFDIYKLNDAKDSWDPMESLGDRVVFLGKNESFSLSASDYPDDVLKPNSIYYAGPSWGQGRYSAHDWGIYNLNDRTVTCHYPCNFSTKIRPRPIWIDRTNATSKGGGRHGMVKKANDNTTMPSYLSDRSVLCAVCDFKREKKQRRGMLKI